MRMVDFPSENGIATTGFPWENAMFSQRKTSVNHFAIAPNTSFCTASDGSFS